MDSGSSNFKIDEEDPEGVLGRGLGRAKGVLIDAGLHSMYVHAIRRAKHFIYIENQFFTGTCVSILTSLNVSSCTFAAVAAAWHLTCVELL